jgi:hypothetical protein
MYKTSIEATLFTCTHTFLRPFYFPFLFLIIHIIPRTFSSDVLAHYHSFMKIKMNIITSCDWIIWLHGLISYRFNRCYTRIFLWEFNNHFTWSRLVSKRNTVKERFRRCLSFCFRVSYSMDSWNSRYLRLLKCDCFPRYLVDSSLVPWFSSIRQNISFSLHSLKLINHDFPVKSFSVFIMLLLSCKKKRQAREMYCIPMYLFSAFLLISMPSHYSLREQR